MAEQVIAGFGEVPLDLSRPRRDTALIMWVRIGAAFCFLAVALGAFGAHALKDILETNRTREVWNTAVLYHFLHGLALIALASQHMNRAVGYLFVAGTVLFSGSLYVLAITGARWLGPITPLGGLCFLAGWLWLFFSSRG